MMYRHGLRVSEAVSIPWEQIDLEAGRFYVRRLKHGKPSVHELNAEQVEALRWLRTHTGTQSPYVFLNTRRDRLCRSSVYKLFFTKLVGELFYIRATWHPRSRPEGQHDLLHTSAQWQTVTNDRPDLLPF